MANPSGRKGWQFEASLLPLIDAYFPGAFRLGKQGANDKGDFYMPNNKLYILEAKNEKTLHLAQNMREALAEAANAGVPFGAVVHKRKLKTAPEEQWLTMQFGDWLKLVHRHT